MLRLTKRLTKSQGATVRLLCVLVSKFGCKFRLNFWPVKTDCVAASCDLKRQDVLADLLEESGMIKRVIINRVWIESNKWREME